MERLKVLVIDDEPGMLTAIHRALENYSIQLIDPNTEVGFAVEETTSGEDALKIIETSKPDILLLDYKLGQLSGMDVLEQIAQKQFSVIAVMITAYASLEKAVTAAKLGAYDFLAKPFTPSELKAAVYRAAKYRMLQRQAQKLVQEKRRFRFELISVVSHELKSPIAAVESYLNILKDRTAGDDLHAYDTMIERGISRLQGMRKLILDLLDLARIESGQKQRDLETVDLSAIAEAAVQSALPDATARHITIHLHVEKPVQLTADKGEIEIIFSNLLSNSIKYNSEGGSASVAVAARHGSIIITVSDTGIGMTAEDTSRIFNDFVRIHNPKTEGIDGSGLGLSIVKKIVGLYEGNISVTSEPDVGSTFTVTLKDIVQDPAAS